MHRLLPLTALIGLTLLAAGCATTPHVPPAPSAAISDARKATITMAQQELGAGYRYGGEGPHAFDCSGLVQYVYAHVGVDLPRTTADQWHAGVHISFRRAQPGDLLFYHFSGNWSGLHVGIYTGRGWMIHASTADGEVKAIDVNTPFWRHRFLSAVRVLP